MTLYQSFLMAISNIMARKVRSLLTMLGIIIGVVAVIVIIGLGNGLEKYMVDSFKSMGTDLLSVNVMGRGSTRTISVDDMYEILDDNPEYFKAMSPTVSLNGAVKIGNETINRTTVTGIGEDYLAMKQFTLTQGRFINYVDITKRHKVAVIGAYVNNEFFEGNGIGKTMRINGQVLEIVGVLEAETDEIEEGGSDDAVYLPYSTAAKLTGTNVISSYSFSMVSEDEIGRAHV